MAIVKTAISLKEHVYKAGKDKAAKFFSDNFSAYVGFLICKDQEPQPQATQRKTDNRIVSAVNRIFDL